MLKNKDIESRCLQVCSSVQNQGFCQKVAENGRENGLLGNNFNE